MEDTEVDSGLRKKKMKTSYRYCLAVVARIRIRPFGFLSFQNSKNPLKIGKTS